jgi:diguanylate cyclase (GGDEF)-like protein
VLTVSIGVATMQGEAFTSSRALVDAADQALYAAKDAGRNRVSSYGPGVPAAEGSATTVVGR